MSGLHPGRAILHGDQERSPGTWSLAELVTPGVPEVLTRSGRATDAEGVYREYATDEQRGRRPKSTGEMFRLFLRGALGGPDSVCQGGGDSAELTDVPG